MAQIELSAITTNDCWPNINRYEIPAGSFADPINPTEVEVLAFVLANYPTVLDTSIFYLIGGGTADNPDFVWTNTNNNTAVTNIEAPQRLILTRYEVPDLAFVDPIAPLDAEVLVWILANYPDEYDGCLWYNIGCGTLEYPDYIWMNTDDNTAVTLLEHPTEPRAVLTMPFATGNDMVVSGASSIPCDSPGASIAILTWRVLDPSLVEVINITGAYGADASGEAGVQYGNYETLYLEQDLGTGSPVCGDITVCLTVTDTCGRVSAEVCDVIKNANSTKLYFTNDGSGGSSGTFEIQLVAPGTSADWDMGDGTFYYSQNTVSHVYSATGNYKCVATICGTNLTQIYADDQGLITSIPAIFGDSPESFPNIIAIQIDDNLLAGPLTSFSYWPNLEVFAANRTGLTGSIPYLGFNTALRIFQVEDNNMSGTHPDLALNTALEDFRILGNNITGSVFNINTLPVIETYMVQGNELTGTIPNITSNTIITFDVGQNQLSGSLPTLNSTSLKVFDAGDNLLTGSVHSLVNVPALVGWRVANNQITGTFPTTATNPNLEQYICFSNSLGGATPDWTANTNLTLVQLGSQLSGSPVTYTNGTITSGSITNWSYRGGTQTFSVGDIDNILCDLSVSASLGNAGTCYVDQNGPTPPSGTGAACVIVLTGNGWSVFTD